MVVGVGVGSEKAIGVGEFTSETCGFSRHRPTGEKFEIPVIGHFLRFWKVRDEALDLSEGHVVQAVVVSELESGQHQNCEKTERCDQEYFSWTRSLRCRLHGFAHWRFFARCRLCS